MAEELKSILGEELVQKFKNWEIGNYEFAYIIEQKQIMNVLLQANGEIVKENSESVEFCDMKERTPRSYIIADVIMLQPKINLEQLLWSGERIVEEFTKEEDYIYYKKVREKFKNKTNEFEVEAKHHECVNCGWTLSHESLCIKFTNVKTKLIILETFYYQDLPSETKKTYLYRVEGKDNKVTTILLAYRSEVW